MIIVTVLRFASLGLFALKIVWNILTPYALAIRMAGAKERRAHGISMLPFLEIVLLVLAVALTSIPGNDGWLHSPKRIALWGASLIALSYLHVIVGSIFAGFIVKILKRRTS